MRRPMVKPLFKCVMTTTPNARERSSQSSRIRWFCLRITPSMTHRLNANISLFSWSMSWLRRPRISAKLVGGRPWSSGCKGLCDAQTSDARRLEIEDNETLLDLLEEKGVVKNADTTGMAMKTSGSSNLEPSPSVLPLRATPANRSKFRQLCLASIAYRRRQSNQYDE